MNPDAKAKAYVIVPAYNAAGTIEDVFKRIPKGLIDDGARFIVVDDGSTDGTMQLAMALRGKYPIEAVKHETNRGYGAAQKSGYRMALNEGADIVVMLHADGQYPPEAIAELMKPIVEGEADIVAGSRILGGKALEGGMPLFRYLGNIFLTRIENLVFRLDVTTYHSGFKAYSRKALQAIDFMKYTDGFHFDTQMYVGAKRNGLRIAEIPIPTRYASEKSHVNLILYGINIFGVMARYLLGGV